MTRSHGESHVPHCWLALLVVPIVSSPTSIIDVHHMSLTMSSLLSYVDTSKPSLWITLFAITFNPTAWNIVARNGASNLIFTIAIFG